MAKSAVEREIWKNVSSGLRHFIIFDPVGNQTHGLVQAGRTFTITALERQMNQQAAHSSDADLFRNGTFVLIKETEETVEDEIASPNSVSDDEIFTAVAEALGGDSVAIEAMLERCSSVVTAQRLLEELIVQDASASLVELAKGKVKEFSDTPLGPDGKPMDIVERETIAPPQIEADGFSKEKALRPR